MLKKQQVPTKKEGTNLKVLNSKIQHFMITKNENICPINNALTIISGKWRLRIIYEIGIKKKRFGELKRLIPEISEKMLIQELKSLATYKIVNRKAYPEIPPKVEYSLTELGKSIFPVINEIEKFGKILTK